jgi:hypothetical protein
MLLLPGSGWCSEVSLLELPPAGRQVVGSETQWRGLVLGASSLSTSMWAGYSSLLVEVANSSTESLRVFVAMRNEPDTWADGHVATFSASLAPACRATWSIPLVQLRYTLGWVWPDQVNLSSIGAWGRVDTTAVREVWIGLEEGSRHRSVTLHRLALSGAIAATGWVDRYGQRSDLAWPGKIDSDADLVAADQREANGLRRPAVFPGRDQYQAWADGPLGRASGFFRVQEISGRWWFVAPSGRLFWATGIDCIVCGADARLDPVVRSAYGWMPPRTGSLSLGWGRNIGPGSDPDSISFYRVNLARKWGEQKIRERWLDRAMARQFAWGFTSLGNWAWFEWDRALDAHPWKKMPYVSMGPQAWSMTITQVANGIHDPYDPDFARQAALACAPLSRYRGDPYLIGHFIQNEVSWSGVVRGTLSLPESVAAKAVLLASLRSRYGNIARLNRLWGASATSFETLRWPDEKAGRSFSPVAVQDMAEFRGALADRWYRLWAAAVRGADPDHLVLGSRLHGGNRPDDVVLACARWCDVVSFNHYEVEAADTEFGRYFRIARKPFLIGEYGFYSLDTGLLSAAVPVSSVAERGVGYRYYTERLAALPYFVGGHWFQYLDEPVTGRFDRETAFGGFVNVGDVPCTPLVQAAIETNARIYPVHAGSATPYDRRPSR